MRSLHIKINTDGGQPLNVIHATNLGQADHDPVMDVWTWHSRGAGGKLDVYHADSDNQVIVAIVKAACS